MKKTILLIVVHSLQLHTFIIVFLFSFVNPLHAQYWHYYNPTFLYDVNTVEILAPGVIVIGGGWKSNDSVQIMFQTFDYGLTWHENEHDGLAPWNKSIAFSDSLNGYGVGDDGRIIKSNDAGKNWGNPVTPINRDLNKIIYIDDSTYYIAGGNKANDSMQTILKSANNGNTWTVIYDALGPWLKSIFFINALNGFAVGDNGVIIHTANGGNTWAPITAPIQRDFNAINFINADTGYIVGGISSGLFRRTILRTVNGGADWNVIVDTNGGTLNDISFANEKVGYIVGDSATVLKTNDGGLNWYPFIIDTSLSGNESFRAVKYLNLNFGVIGGKSGVVYVFFDPRPFVLTTLPTDISFNTARLNGSFDAGGTATTVKFEYGASTAYGNVIAAVPDTSSIVGNVNTYALLTGLIANTTYHYRIKGITSVLTNYGKDMQFYTGFSEIPNFNFETWTPIIHQMLDGWDIAVGRISQYSPACHFSRAVKIQNDTVSGGQPGAIFIGRPTNKKGGFTFVGGTPFNARPDTLIGCFNYSIQPNDSALVLLILKRQGVIISNNLFTIYGSSLGNYTNLRFPIQYTSIGIADSLIMAFTVTDVRNMQPQLAANSFLIVDNIRFTGTTANIPNNDFENWETNTFYSLDNWWYLNKYFPLPSHPSDLPVSRVTDVQNGIYAVKIQSFLYPNDTTEGKLYTINSIDQWFIPSFSVNSQHHTFTGYYKYFPQHNDTMSIIISMFKNGTQIGYGNFLQKDSVSSYEPFIVNIIYASPTQVPDSASINIQTFKGYHHPLGNSIVYVDNLNFDGFLAGIKEPPLTTTDNIGFNVYPNPFSEHAIVSFITNKDEYITVRLFDLSGKQVVLLADGKYTTGNHKIDLSAEGLQKGFYICVINTEKAVCSKKLIVF